MDIFKGLLFLEGHYADAAFVPEDFGERYGNAQATQRRFADRWFAERWDSIDATEAERSAADTADCG